MTRRVGAGLPPVLVDPDWVGKALDELLDALVHTPPGTPVTLGAAAGADGRVRRRLDGWLTRPARGPLPR